MEEEASTSTSGGGSSGKRRLSHRVGSSADKRIKGELNRSSRGRGLEHPERDEGRLGERRNDLKGVDDDDDHYRKRPRASSTPKPGYHQSPFDSLSPLNSEEEPWNGGNKDKTTISSGSTGRDRASFIRPDPLTTLPPRSAGATTSIWQEGISGASSESIDHQPTSSSSRSSRHRPYQGSSESTFMPSPPPSFNLSSGQPLVGPPQKTQAAFVGKLYSMLEDPEIAKTGLIHWSPDGTLFSCPNPTEFSKVVLPQFFKHNNWQSFVRQLNMYSFNKVSRPDWSLPDTQVNDLYPQTGTTDPMAWEFRHPLFRRDQPHLLAQIKRKTTRTSQQEGGLTSPIEEDIPMSSKAVAGWMRDPAGPSFRVTSPPSTRVGYLPATTAESGRPRGFWNDERGGGFVSAMSQNRLPPPQPLHQEHRNHPESNRPTGPASAGRFNMPPSYPESPFYPQPNPPAEVQALSSQIATLEDRVERLSGTLLYERIEHVKTTMEFTQSLLQMSTLLPSSGVQQGVPDIRSLQESLSHQAGELRHKYDSLMASDTLASLRTSRGGGDDRRPRSAYEQRTFPALPYQSSHHTLLDPRSSSQPYPHSQPHYPSHPSRPSPNPITVSHLSYHISPPPRPSVLPMAAPTPGDQSTSSYPAYPVSGISHRDSLRYEAIRPPDSGSGNDGGQGGNGIGEQGGGEAPISVTMGGDEGEDSKSKSGLSSLLN